MREKFTPKVIPTRGPLPTICRSGKDNVCPAYVYVKRGKVARTDELIPGRVTADFNSAGQLLGVEVIG